MRRVRAIQITGLLLILAIALTVAINTIENPASQKLDSSNVCVLPAELVWQKTYGGAGDDRAFGAVPAGDGYLVVGSTKSIVPNATVGWTLRLDSSGNAVWNQTFLEGSGTELRCAINLTDGFLLVGNEFLQSGDINGYVAKIDKQGSVAWNTTVGGAKMDKLFSAIATSDGFVVFGLTNSYGNGESDVWAVKLNANGSELWNKTFPEGTDCAARAGIYISEGDFLLAGYASFQNEDYSFLLMKIDGAGNLVWNKTYSEPQSEKAYAIAKAADGYVIVGDSDSTQTDIDARVLKVDFNGTMMWTETVGGKKADSPSCITASKDGGFLIGGFTFSYGAGERDFWLFKIDASGKVLWSCTQGNDAFQEAYSVIEADGNRYFMAGWTDPFGQPPLIGKKTYEFYVVELCPAQGDGIFSVFLLMAFGFGFVALAAAVFLLFMRLHKAAKTKL
jgi:hypothetical protein